MKMPGTYCAVFGSGRRGGHEFPKNQQIQNLWRLAIKRANYKRSRWPTANSIEFCAQSFYFGKRGLPHYSSPNIRISPHFVFSGIEIGVGGNVNLKINCKWPEFNVHSIFLHLLGSFWTTAVLKACTKVFRRPAVCCPLSTVFSQKSTICNFSK